MFDFGLEFVEFYRFEFSQEYGYLRLSDKARRTVSPMAAKIELNNFLFAREMSKLSMLFWTRRRTSALDPNLDEFYSMSGLDTNGSS